MMISSVEVDLLSSKKKYIRNSQREDDIIQLLYQLIATLVRDHERSTVSRDTV
jgi:hypothetical protein